MSGPDAGDLSSAFAQELRNFQEIAHWLMPERGEVPRLAGLDVWGSTRALRGAVGGDHDGQARIAEAEARGAATVVDELRRCSHRAGIAVLDAAGHQMTDALLAAMIHQAFLLGALYELELVRPADAVRPVGADPEPHHVGDDQQRQVLQRQRVLPELVERRVEVRPFPLVLPGEVAALPDVGPSRRRRCPCARPARSSTSRPTGPPRPASARRAGGTSR